MVGQEFASLGHNNDKILRAIKKQMNKFCHADYNEFNNPLVDKLSKKIVSYSPNKSKKIWYSGNSGSEAIEAAMKLVTKCMYLRATLKK